MEDQFSLPVIHNGQELEFKAQLLNFGYSSKIEVEIDGLLVRFEPDEERNWRALLSYDDAIAGKRMDPGLLKVIADTITDILK